MQEGKDDNGPPGGASVVDCNPTRVSPPNLFHLTGAILDLSHAVTAKECFCLSCQYSADNRPRDMLEMSVHTSARLHDSDSPAQNLHAPLQAAQYDTEMAEFYGYCPMDEVCTKAGGVLTCGLQWLACQS